MKKYISVIILTLFYICNASADTVSATIEVTAKITALPCVVDTDTVNKPVDLGSVFAHNMTAGTGSEWKEFELSVHDCPANWTKAVVTFTGTPAAEDGYFANSGTGADGLVLQITDRSHSVNYGNNDQMTVDIDTDRRASFPLAARMYSPEGSASAGDFSSVIQIDFTYQ